MASTGDTPGVPAMAFCHACRKPARSACSRCKSALYCDEVCQKAAWPTHKADCRAIASAALHGVEAPANRMLVNMTPERFDRIASMTAAVAAVDAAFGVPAPREGEQPLLLREHAGAPPPRGLSPAARVERYVQGLAAVDDAAFPIANTLFRYIFTAAGNALAKQDRDRLLALLKERKIGAANK